jgi:molybdopterin/thiamine biosynthesis adenylyltransferase
VTGLRSDIDRLATEKTAPDGTIFRSIAARQVESLAAASGVRGWSVELCALENGIIPERYSRNMKSFSISDQIRLLKSRVAIVGLGGLGGAVTEILARAGVGRLELIDGDHFDESNLNRQLLSQTSRLGTSKALAAKDRTLAINPSVEARSHDRPLDGSNAHELLQGCDLAVDCLDNIASRLSVEAAARELKMPMVSAAIAGECGHVTTIFPGDGGLALIYGDGADASQGGAERLLGNLPHCAMIAASLECSEVIKVLLKRGAPLRNRLLVFDLSSNTFEEMALT